MKIWKIKKVLNEVIVIGFFMFVLLTFVETSKNEDLIIVGIFAVSYTAAKIKAIAEKEKKFRKGRKDFRNKKFSKKEKESE